MATKRSKAQIFNGAREMLAMAENAAADLASGDPTKRRPAVMNLAVYGRSITNIIEGLRSIEPGFDDWYKPLSAKMNGDPLMRFFYELRSEVLKEGGLPVGQSTYIGHMDGAVIQRLMASAPPGTESMFFGDQTGGNGWEVRMPAGTLEKVYFEMPRDIDITSALVFNDPPREHAGAPISDFSVEHLGRLYYEAMARFLDDAVQHFGG